MRLLDNVTDPEEDRSAPRFVMDYSLFRVAKHLRLLGYDTVCDPRLAHAELLPCAAQQKRILVSGSRTLEQQVARRNKLAARHRAKRTAMRNDEEESSKKQVIAYNSDGDSVYMSSSDDDDSVDVTAIHVQAASKHDATLVSILQQLRLPWDSRRVFTRCVGCNRLIKPVSKPDVQDLVHPTVYRVYSCFYQCPECLKVYWGVDNGVVVNFKALRTIEYLKRYCLQEGVHIEEKDLHIQRHFLSFPRAVKCTIFSYLTNDDLDNFLIVLPMMEELIGIVRSGGATKFVPQRRPKKGKNYNELS